MNPDDTPGSLRTAGGSRRPDWPAIESAIRQLAVNYTLGTDAIGRSDVDTGRALYLETFTADAEIMVAGAEATRRAGPEQWVEFVESTFRGRDDIATQHLVGSINVVLDESGPELTAEMSSYMHASHVRPNGDVLVVLLTYVDEVVQRDGGWRIAKRVLYPTASWFQRAEAS